MLLLLAAALPALAHQPWIAAPGQYASAEDAFPIPAIDLSLVVYDQLSCDAPSLWLSFDAVGGESLYAQLGMPMVDRQIDWRPSMAILAAGLPPADLPFDVPEGLGALVYDSSDVESLTVFEEPFTGTTDWILEEETVTLPAGRGYVVAWDPAGLTGKVWLATGTREEFDSDTIARVTDLLDDLRAYHELDGAPAGELVACETVDEEDTAVDAKATSTGCSTAPQNAGTAAGTAAAGLLLLGARRRPLRR